jgi:hypothetical protein
MPSSLFCCACVQTTYIYIYTHTHPHPHTHITHGLNCLREGTECHQAFSVVRAYKQHIYIYTHTHTSQTDCIMVLIAFVRVRSATKPSLLQTWLERSCSRRESRAWHTRSAYIQYNYIHVYIYIYTHIHIYMYNTYICTYTYICIMYNTYICTYTYTYICICICMCIHMHIYVCVYIYIIKCHKMSFYNIYVYVVTILVSRSCYAVMTTSRMM